MTHIASSDKEDVPYYFSRSSVKFHCHAGQKVGFGSNLGKITRPVAAVKSLIFALFQFICQFIDNDNYNISITNDKIETFSAISYAN